ncbi:MAG: hypothetical protein RH862_03595 [Leptospiraceae bacterium]
MIRRLFIFALLLPVSLLADTVILKSGQEVDGQIINQSETTITIRTRQGVQTIGKGTVRRIFYGDAYRNQQDELKRKREEELRRKEEEEKRKAEEEAKRLEEQKRKAAEAAREEAEQERLERERQEAEEKARLKEQQKEARDARNPVSIWIFAGPGGAKLMPGNFRDNLSLLSLFGQELSYLPDKTEGSAGVFGFGFSIPVWDMLFFEAEGMATGQFQDFLVFEGGKDTVDSGSGSTRAGFGLGDYGRILRTTGDLRIGYNINLQELGNLTGISLEEDFYKRIEIEPVLGYKFRQHDSVFSSTSTGYSSFGPSLYLANDNGSIFSKSKGPTWGFRLFYSPLTDYPVTLELGLYAYSLTADIEANMDRNVLFNLGVYQLNETDVSYKSSIEGSIVTLGASYGVTENLDVFVRLRGETAEFKTERLTVENRNSANPSSTQTSLGVLLLNPLIAPMLDTTEEVGSLEIGLTRRY